MPGNIDAIKDWQEYFDIVLQSSVGHTNVKKRQDRFLCSYNREANRFVNTLYLYVTLSCVHCYLII